MQHSLRLAWLCLNRFCVRRSVTAIFEEKGRSRRSWPRLQYIVSQYVRAANLASFMFQRSECYLKILIRIQRTIKKWLGIFLRGNEGRIRCIVYSGWNIEGFSGIQEDRIVLLYLIKIEMNSCESSWYVQLFLLNKELNVIGKIYVEVNSEVGKNFISWSN